MARSVSAVMEKPATSRRNAEAPRWAISGEFEDLFRRIGDSNHLLVDDRNPTPGVLGHLVVEAVVGVGPRLFGLQLHRR